MKNTIKAQVILFSSVRRYSCSFFKLISFNLFFLSLLKYFIKDMNKQNRKRSNMNFITWIILYAYKDMRKIYIKRVESHCSLC
jgi:hypothetical protein